MGVDQVPWFRVYATFLTLFAIAVSTFLIYSFSQQIHMVNLLPGLHLLYTELFITSLLLPLSVVLFILSSRRKHLLQCSEGKFPTVEVVGLVVYFLSIAALVAGTVLSWLAANTIDESYQVYHLHEWYFILQVKQVKICCKSFRYWATVSALWLQINHKAPPIIMIG